MQHITKLNAIAEALEKMDPVAAEQIDILNNKMSAETIRHTGNKLSREVIRRMIVDDVLQGFDQNLLSIFQEYLDIVDKDWNYITPTELYDKIKSASTEFFILDIRRKEDYDAGHIPGAKNIFWLDILKPENIAQLPRDKKILIYCYVGHTSSQLLVILKILGYDVVALKFGMGKSPVKGVPVSGWLNYGYPTESNMSSVESSLQGWIKGLLHKIPGLPSKEEALKTVSDFCRKDPQKFNKVVEELNSALGSTSGKTAFDIRGLIRNIKTITDPKIILSIIALMGAFQTSDAGVLRDRILHKNVQQEVSQSPSWVTNFEKSNQGASGSITHDGKECAVGKAVMGPTERDPNFSKTMADSRARQAGGQDLVQRYLGSDASGNTVMYSLFSK